MMRVTQGTDWLAAVGVAGIAGEWPVPPYYRMLLTGLRTIPGLSEDALELFVGHIELDLEHSRMIEDAILPHLGTREGQASLWRGIELNLNARLVQLSGLQREVFGN
jgi:pyrroloquinoline-quinone synthase